MLARAFNVSDKTQDLSDYLSDKGFRSSQILYASPSRNLLFHNVLTPKQPQEVSAVFWIPSTSTTGHLSYHAISGLSFWTYDVIILVLQGPKLANHAYCPISDGASCGLHGASNQPEVAALCGSSVRWSLCGGRGSSIKRAVPAAWVRLASDDAILATTCRRLSYYEFLAAANPLHWANIVSRTRYRPSTWLSESSRLRSFM